MAILTIGDQFPDFELTALKGGDLQAVNAQQPEDYFETVTNQSYEGILNVFNLDTLVIY